MLRDRALVPLSQQHHNGLALCVLTDRSLQADDSPDNAARLAARALDRYDLEIANHFAVEEEVVFPLIERELGEYPILDELIAEHRHVERVVEQLRLAPEAATLRELTSVLRSHIRREESDLFEVIQQRLSRKVLDAMGAEVDTKAVRIPI
jgi:hemerythrin-like domain-containing protein